MNATILVFFIIFIIYFFSLNFLYIGLTILAFYGSSREVYTRKYTPYNIIAKSTLTPPISIIIPAFNEELDVVNSLYSALNSKYPEFEVIFVNDGSTDETFSLVKKEFGLHIEDVFYKLDISTEQIKGVYTSKKYPNLKAIDKVNGGKADALNAGINLAGYHFIVNTDADSIFDEEGLLRIGRLISVDPTVVGVGGQLRIGNGLQVEKGKVIKKKLPRGLVPNFQVVEYLGSFLGNRTGWSEINSVLVLSGAFGLWNKQKLVEMGGYSRKTTHEDIELTVRTHRELKRKKEDYKILFVADPIVWTEVPSTWRGIFKQRRRWQRVVNEVAWKYKSMFFNPRYGTVGIIGMPYLVLFEALGPIIELAAYIIIIVLFSTGAISVGLFLLFLLFSFGLTIVVRIAGVFIEQYSFRTFPLRQLPRLFLFAIFESVGYHQFILLARVIGILDFFTGRRSWERIKRKGFK